MEMAKVAVASRRTADELKPDEFMGVRQVAAALGVSYPTVRGLIRRGELRALEVVPGTFRIRKCWLEQYVEDFAKGGL